MAEFYRGADGAGHGCCGAVIDVHVGLIKGNAAQRGHSRGHKVHLKRKRAYLTPPTLTPIRGQRRRRHQGRCLEHVHSRFFPRPPGASPPYIAHRQKLRVSLVGRFYLVGVFSSFLVFYGFLGFWLSSI